MEIDLGSVPKANVKVGADVFEMSVPTVRQSLKFNEKLNSADNDSGRTEVFIELIAELGMPTSTVELLSLQQLTKLAEGLMGSPEKK